MKDIPKAITGESATVYADRAGRWYAEKASAEHKKEFGQYLTPVAVAEYMANLFKPQSQTVRVLDPGAGAGILSCALCESLAERKKPPNSIELTAYETDKDLAVLLKKTLTHLKDRLVEKGVALEFTINTDDFVLAHAACLDDSPRLFDATPVDSSFDVVISNPPYFKIPKSDPRAQAAAAVVHGQPNMYGLFMAISAYLLSPLGQLIFITPRSFASGPYFRRFREKFFEKVTPELIHIFGSRRDAFNRDEILQENIILKAVQTKLPARELASSEITISCSNGANDLATPVLRTVALDFILDLNSPDKVLRIPVSNEDDEIIRLVHSWTGSLRQYGLEISTGPVVPFRAVPLLSEEGNNGTSHAPLLWMQHVKPLCAEWPVKVRKPQYIQINNESKPLLVPDKNYVLLRRFSAKEEQRRLTAAALIAGTLGSPWVGLENHLNYIHRPKGSLTEAETWGLTALLTSSLLDKYFRAVNGNTQVSATELRAMPLPPLELIIRLGNSVMSNKSSTSDIDFLVTNELAGFAVKSAQLVGVYG